MGFNSEEPGNFNPNEMREYFSSPKGLPGVVPGFRARDEQLRMAEAVAAALNNSEFLLAEAGTGVGKSFAYLIPAAFWSVYSGERVVVATKTRALQKQISEKDMPDVARVIKGGGLNWAEAKGRENYLCWNKYIGILSGRRSLDQDESRFVSAILSWAESTASGDRQELNISSQLMRRWGIVAADRHTCLRDRCTFREKCFRLKMIKKLEQANIIITNHALLLSDLMVDNRILPEYKYLVVDEAHNLDREAFDKFSSVFSCQETFEILNRLSGDYSKHEQGFLPAVRKSYPELEKLSRENETHAVRSRDLSRQFFSQLSGMQKGKSQVLYSVVMEEQLYDEPEFNDLSRVHLEWQEATHLLISGLKELRDVLAGQPEENELATYISILQYIADSAYYIMEESINRDDFLHWVDYIDGAPASISASPVGMSHLLYERLYSKMETVVLVSATIAVNHGFSYAIEHLGLQPVLEQERLNTLLEESPFPYQQQACLFCVDDIPDPESREYSPEIAAVLTGLIETAGGSTMVLFTSRQQLAEVSTIIRPAVEENGINLLVQNEDGDFGALLAQFTSSRKSVLMGLDTFWEGIDLRGELLRCVVLVKLPFRPPNEPFSSACLKDCRIKGKNGFLNFLLPDAAVRFKQGVGRLIRSEEDYGAVIVLDPRIITKSYGRTFCASIPIKNIKPVKSRDLAAELVLWLENHSPRQVMD